MLQFNRKQMAAIGESNLRTRLRGFLGEHFPPLRSMPAEEVDRELDQLIAESRQQGLRSQRAVALYALANVALGRERVEADPTVRRILAARERPLADRTLMLEIWLTQTWGSLQGTRP